MLTITEETLLLILDTDKGDIRRSLSRHSRDIVLAGAVLTDLARENRVDTDPQQLVVTDPTPLGDELLDPVLSDIVRDPDTHDTGFWIERTAERSDEILQRARSRLVARGILESDASGFTFFTRRVAHARRYATVDGETTEDVHLRIMRAVFSDDLPDPRDAIIISLASACGVFETILSRDELAEVQERIDVICRLDLIGRSVAAALRAQATPAPRPPARPSEQIPLAPGWPLAGNAFELAADVRGFLTRQYLRLGPIFGFRAFNHRYIALVGPEANTFVTNAGKTLFRSHEAWRDFNSATGAKRLMVSMDGSEHLQMRKAHAKAYSPRYAEGHAAEIVDITRQAIAEWPQGRSISGQYALQRIVAEQIGVVTTSVSPRDYIDDLIIYLDTLLETQVWHLRPKLMMYRPRFRRARERLMGLYGKVMAAHEDAHRDDDHRDLIDDLLDLHRRDPQFLPEADLPITVLGPFLAGIDTSANTCAFMLYALLKHPQLCAQMTAEVDALFDRGPPTEQGLRQLDITHRILLETLRMYPVIPGMTRTASNSFEFAGYHIPAGTQVMIGNTVGHHLPELFPDAQRFDIDRYAGDRAEHRQPAYAPFGLGRHRCLGSGFAEIQIALTMATIVREAELVLARPGRPLKIKPMPTRHPDAGFRFRLVRRRQRDV